MGGVHRDPRLRVVRAILWTQVSVNRGAAGRRVPRLLGACRELRIVPPIHRVQSASGLFEND